MELGQAVYELELLLNDALPASERGTRAVRVHLWAPAYGGIRIAEVDVSACLTAEAKASGIESGVSRADFLVACNEEYAHAGMYPASTKVYSGQDMVGEADEPKERKP